MNLSRNLLNGVALPGLLPGSCTSKVTDKAQDSGYLTEYNNLREVNTPRRGQDQRWWRPS